MEGVHIKLESDEALFTKKELLSSRMNTLELLKRVKQYKALRSKEFIVYGRFKKALLDLKKQVIELQDSMPKQDVQKKHMQIVEELYKKKSSGRDILEEITPPKTKKKTSKKTEKKTTVKIANLASIEDELKSVQEKLASLE